MKIPSYRNSGCPNDKQLISQKCPSKEMNVPEKIFLNDDAADSYQELAIIDMNGCNQEDHSFVIFFIVCIIGVFVMIT